MRTLSHPIDSFLPLLTRRARLRRTARAQRRSLSRGIEFLEDRRLLASDITIDPSAGEQELLEHINRMRLNPADELEIIFRSTDPNDPGYFVSDDADINSAMNYFHVNKSVLLSQWSSLSAAAPLAWSDGLYAGANAHNERMVLQDQQSHQLPADSSLGLAAEASLLPRLVAAGYTWTGSISVGENVFAFASSLFQSHAAFAIDWGFTSTGIQNPPGHRNNIMNSSFKEAGISVIEEYNSSTSVGEYVVTHDFGSRGNYGNPRALGVVYTDNDGDGRYDAGEGAAGVTIEISDGSATYTTTTMTAGGYQVQVPPGAYNVTASGGGLPGPVSMGSITVGSANVKLDLETTAIPPGGAVTGVLYFDADQDGTQDAGDSGVSGWTVYLDADNDGQLDSGERTATSASGGSYSFTDVAAGTYQLRYVAQPGFRATSAAWQSVTVTGGSTASTLSFGVYEFAVTNGSTIDVYGTNGDDEVSWQAGSSHTIHVNGDQVTANSSSITSVNFHGGSGSDSITLTAGADRDTAIVRLGTVTLTSDSYSVSADDFETVDIDSHGGINERAYLYDSAGNDVFVGQTTWARISGSGFFHEVSNFDRVYAYAREGGDDHVNLYDGASNDRFYGLAAYSLLRGENLEFYNYAFGFDEVHAFATSGGTDTAYLYDSASNDYFYGLPDYAVLRPYNDAFYNHASGFERVNAISNKGGNDYAYLHDSSGDDQFYGYADHSYLRGPDSEFYNDAEGFVQVYAYASNGGTDFAFLYDSPNDDRFYGYEDHSLLRGSNFEYLNDVENFERVYAYANNGGDDYAFLYDSVNDDRYFGFADYSIMRGANFEFYNNVSAFDEVYAYAGTGGDDIAYLYGSIGDDRFFAPGRL